MSKMPEIKSIFNQLAEKSEKIDLDAYLETFKGLVFQGRKGFRLAEKYIRQGTLCLCIFHNWWVVLRNGADWMNCLKLTGQMNDWKGNDSIGPFSPKDMIVK